MMVAQQYGGVKRMFLALLRTKHEDDKNGDSTCKGEWEDYGRKEWILLLLSAPPALPEKESPPPFQGELRLMNSLYLLDRLLWEDFDCESPFKFETTEIGPVDKQVSEIMSDLNDNGEIKITNGNEINTDLEGNAFSVTEKVEEKTIKRFESFPQELQDTIRWIRYDRGQKPLGHLLSYIYGEYPSAFE